MSFYVTLPSNASTIQYKNTQSNYTTQLDTAISLTIPYEVAIVEFSFREHIIIDIGEIFIKFNHSDIYIPYSLTAFENEPIEHFCFRITQDILTYYTKHKIYMNVINENNKLDYSVNNTKFIEKWWSEYSAANNTDFEHIQNDMREQVLEFKNPTLYNIFLVLPPKAQKDNVSIKFKGFCLELFRMKEDQIVTTEMNHAYYPEQLNFYDYLMVYSDLVEYQYVGDTFAPLLRTICKTGTFNHTTEKIFINPHYIPIKKSYINSINIDIRDSSGSPVKFASQSSKVLTKLHFRPCKTSY